MPDSDRDLLGLVGDWRSLLADSPDDEIETTFLRERVRTGRPCGDAAFLAGAERLTGRLLRRQRPGPRPEETRR